MRSRQDSAVEGQYPSERHPRPNARRYLYALIFVIFVLVVATQGAAAPAVLGCLAAVVSAGVSLRQHTQPSFAKHSC
jgi:hypothetical protein